VADSRLDRQQFARAKGWDDAKVDKLCADLKKQIQDYAEENGMPPGIA
jgi:hypothetical protein